MTAARWLALAVIVAAMALAVAHVVHEPERIDPKDYAEWRAYCTADADTTHVRGTRAWTDEVNDCLVDVATADARYGHAVTFVLDLDSNPHPRMLAEALEARSKSVTRGLLSDCDYWRGFLAAMAAATGCEPADLVAWMDRHECST